MKAVEFSLPGVLLLTPEPHSDKRGSLYELYDRRQFAAAGITDDFVKDNYVISAQNVVRGLHYQLHHPQAKLCRVTQGQVLDVVVDVRRGSPTFGKCSRIVLSADNQRLLYVPKGYAHGYAVLSHWAEFLYKCSDYHYPEDERGILWNDAALGIDWIVKEPILSEKDASLPTLFTIPDSDLPVY